MKYLHRCDIRYREYTVGMVPNGFDSRRLHLRKDPLRAIIWAGLCVAIAPFMAPSRRDEPAHSHPSRPMFTIAICALALLAYGCIVKRADAATPHWQPASASWYQPTGNHTSCGDPFTDQSWSVAALSPSVYDCHVVITICNRRRCVRVPISDRGAWRTDGRLWDLSPRVKRALHCSDLCQVRWTR